MSQKEQGNQHKVRERPVKPVQVVLSPLLVDARGVAAMLGVSRRTVYSMQSSGELGPMARTVGGRKLWCVAELTAWVDSGCPHRQQWVKLREMAMRNKQLCN